MSKLRIAPWTDRLDEWVKRNVPDAFVVIVVKPDGKGFTANLLRNYDAAMNALAAFHNELGEQKAERDALAKADKPS